MHSNLGDEKTRLVRSINYDNTRKADLHFDSNDKVDGTYQRAFFDNKNKLVNKQVYNMGVKEIHINYGIHNINQSNNTFFFTVQTGPPISYTIQLTPGNYTTTSALGTEIVSKMNAQTNIFTLSATTDTSYTITSTTAFNFDFSSGIEQSDCTGIFVSDPHTIIEFFPTLQYTRYIDFIISELKNNIITRDTFSSTKTFSEKDHIARVYVDHVNGELKTEIPRKIIQKNKNINYFPVRSRDIDSCEIRLYNDKGLAIYSAVQNINGKLYEEKHLTYDIIFTMTS